MDPGVALPGEGPSGCLLAVACDAGAVGRDQHRAYAVGPLRVAAGEAVAHERLAQVVPRQGDVLAVGADRLCPEGTQVAGTSEAGFSGGNLLVAEGGVDSSLDFALQPAGHLDVVGVDARFVAGQFALQEQHVPRPARREQDAPEAGVAGDRAVVGLAEADVRVLAGEQKAIGVNGAGGSHGSYSYFIPSPLRGRVRVGVKFRGQTRLA